jgi:hypothetical protein
MVGCCSAVLDDNAVAEFQIGGLVDPSVILKSCMDLRRFAKYLRCFDMEMMEAIPL